MSDLLLHCTLLAMMFVCFIGMGELILVENFVHRGFFGVSGVGRIWRFREGCLWGHILVISGRGDGSSRLREEQSVRFGKWLMGGNGIVYSAIHGAGLDSVCTRGWDG